MDRRARPRRLARAGADGLGQRPDALSLGPQTRQSHHNGWATWSLAMLTRRSHLVALSALALPTASRAFSLSGATPPACPRGAGAQRARGRGAAGPQRWSSRSPPAAHPAARRAGESRQSCSRPPARASGGFAHHRHGEPRGRAAGRACGQEVLVTVKQLSVGDRALKSGQGDDAVTRFFETKTHARRWASASCPSSPGATEKRRPWPTSAQRARVQPSWPWRRTIRQHPAVRDAQDASTASTG